MATPDSSYGMRYVSVDELSRLSGLSLSTIHRLKKAGKIPFYQPAGKGGRILFPHDAIERAQLAMTSVPDTVAAPKLPSPRLSGPAPAWMNTQTN